jgi:hypothetical protein
MWEGTLLFTDKRKMSGNDGKSLNVRTHHVQIEPWGPMRLASLTFMVFITYPPHITGPQVLTTVLGSSGLAGPRTHVRKGADTPRMFYIIVLMICPAHVTSLRQLSQMEILLVVNKNSWAMCWRVGERCRGESLRRKCLKRWLCLLTGDTNGNLSACKRSGMMAIHTHHRCHKGIVGG